MIEEASSAHIETQPRFKKIMHPPGIPFAVGPVATLKNGYRGGAGNVENFASEEETAAHLLDAQPHGYNQIVAKKTGLYLAVLSGEIKSEIEVDCSDPRYAELYLEKNGTTILTPGLKFETKICITSSTELSGYEEHSHTIDMSGSEGGLQASHVRVLYLEADDYIKAYLSGSSGACSCSDVRLDMMFLCPRPPS
jgi:hypothetical protein